MHVIVVGAGEVGYQVARFLSAEEVDVVIIDRDKSKLKRVSEQLDVATIEGEGGSYEILREAGASKTDMLLAVTDSDESNMISCLIAKSMFDIPWKIARIRNPEYLNNQRLLSPDHLDVNPAISPEVEVATAIVRLLEIPFAVDVEDLEGGAIKIIGCRIPENSPLSGKALKELRGVLPPQKFLVGIIERAGKVIIPTGEERIESGDTIYIPTKKWEIGDIVDILGVSGKPARKVMILGGGRIGHFVASSLEDKASVKVIERDEERSKELSHSLSKSVVLMGDGSDRDLLEEENVSDMDVFVAVSNNEEVNIMASLLAKKLGVKKTITIVNRTDYIPLAHSLGLEAVLSPRLITASSILRYVRRGDILALTAVAENKAEIIEARIGESSKLKGRKLQKAKLPKNSLVGVIVRDGRITFPSGADEILQEDKVIIFALRESIRDVEKLLV